MEFVPASKFGYSALPFSMYFPNCSDCIFTVGEDGCRHWGMVNPCSLSSPYYGKLVLYCRRQEAYVLPGAKCSEFRDKE